jgi:CBS domain-containing protein
MDILDFLGGGDKYKIFEEKYPGNFLGAVNESVKEIMTRKVEVLSHKDSIKNAISKMRKENVGALPVVDGDQKMVGIVSERDFVMLLSGVLTDELVEDYMTEKVISTTPGTRIEGASKIMVRNQLRRIPVVGEERKTPHPEKDKIMGIVTATDILEFLGKNSVFDKMVSNNAEDVLNTTITEIMEKTVVATTSNTRLGDLCNSMEIEGIGGLPVVHNGDLEGIITERDILKAVSKL